MLTLGYRFRLYATTEQEKKLWQFAGACRSVYNIALEQRRDWKRQFQRNTGYSINVASQNRELTALRREFHWIAAAPIDCQQYALRDLDQAFRNFYAGRAGYPTPRKRGRHDAFRFPFVRSRWRKLNAKWGFIHIPKIGEVKFRLSRSVVGRIRNVTVKHDVLGWHVVFCCEIEHTPQQNLRPAVGVDWGVVHVAALSTGEMINPPTATRERLNLLDRRARKQARALARKRHGSNRRRAARRALARTKAHTARRRRHWCHERTTCLVRTFGMVVIEDLDIRAMTASARGTTARPGHNVRQKAGLNRAILTACWGQIATQLAYKLVGCNGELRRVKPAHTSQTCAVCGAIDKGSRKSQAVFQCVHCGHTANADTNAARNILKAGAQPAPRMAAGPPMKRELTRKHRVSLYHGHRCSG